MLLAKFSLETPERTIHSDLEPLCANEHGKDLLTDGSGHSSTAASTCPTEEEEICRPLPPAPKQNVVIHSKYHNEIAQMETENIIFILLTFCFCEVETDEESFLGWAVSNFGDCNFFGYC